MRQAAAMASADMRLSPLRGRGMEYAESREYVAGDDARHIDWRLTARTGRAHTKLFQAERERLTLIVADTAPALYFGTRVRFKSVQAARAGAVAAWAAARDGDRIAALRGSDGEAPVPPASGARGALRVLDALVRWYATARRRCGPGGRARPCRAPAAPRLAAGGAGRSAQRRGHRRAALARARAASRSHRAAADRSARTRRRTRCCRSQRRPPRRTRPRQRRANANVGAANSCARSKPRWNVCRRAACACSRCPPTRPANPGCRCSAGPGRGGVMPAITLVLRDIHQPPAPPWWPPAPGWWLVAAMLLLALAVASWFAARRRKRQRAIARCSMTLAARRTPAAQVAAMSELLRRAARRVNPKPTSAGRSLAAFPRCGRQAAACSRRRGRLLLEGGYRREVDAGQVAALSAAGACALPRMDGATMIAADSPWTACSAASPGRGAAALPLPLLARWLLPPHRNTSAALKVPYGTRLDAIAAPAGMACAAAAGWLAWLAWVLLCVAAARPQQLGEPVPPPQAGRDLMLARGPVRQHERAGHGARRQPGRPADRGQGGARRFPRSPRRRSRRPAGVRPARLRADAADARPRYRCASSSRQRGRPGRARDRDRRCDRSGGQAPARRSRKASAC